MPQGQIQKAAGKKIYPMSHLLIHLIHIYLIHLTPDRKTNRDWVKVAADHSAKGHSDYSHIMPSGKWTLHRTFDGTLYFSTID